MRPANEVLYEIRNVFSDEIESDEFEPAWLDFNKDELQACKELEEQGFLSEVPTNLKQSQSNFTALVIKI